MNFDQVIMSVTILAVCVLITDLMLVSYKQGVWHVVIALGGILLMIVRKAHVILTWHF